MKRFPILMALAAVLVLGLAGVADAAKTELASKQSGPGGAAADRNSDQVVLSDNGRYVAFSSRARNLDSAARMVRNVFRYDRRTDKTILVSRRPESRGGGGANGNSSDPVISGNGRFVAFSTKATNLGGRERRAVRDTYLVDLRRDRVRLVSKRSDGRPSAFNSLPNDLDFRGRRLVLETSGNDLGGPAQNVNGNIYIYFRHRKGLRLVSRQSRSDGSRGANLRAQGGSISDDGRFIAFSTMARNLGGDLRSAWNVYIYDHKRKRVQHVSRRRGGKGANGFSFHADISANGRFVAFETHSQNLGGPRRTRINVYRYDRRTRKQRLASRRSGRGAGANGSSQFPSISRRGRFVAFETVATNLGGDRVVAGNVYFRRMPRGGTHLASKASGGTGGDGPSGSPSLSLHGREVAFLSEAANLGGAPTAEVNAYHRRLTGG